MTWPSWPSWYQCLMTWLSRYMMTVSDDMTVMVHDVNVWHDHLACTWCGLGGVVYVLASETLQHSNTPHYTLHTSPMLQSPSGPRLGDTQLTRSSRASNIIFSTSFCRKCKAIQWIAKNNFHWKYFNNFFFMEIKCLLLLKHMKFWPNLEFSEFYITS